MHSRDVNMPFFHKRYDINW